MEKGYRFRIYPTDEQINLIERTFGCCRYVYNHYLDMRKTLYESEKKSFGYNACSKDMTSLKKELEWLKEVDSTALQSSLRDLDTAYKNFFDGIKEGRKVGYPQIKRKHGGDPSFKSKMNIKIVSGDCGTCIISTTHHNTRMLAIQISCASQESVYTVAILVSPV